MMARTYQAIVETQKEWKRQWAKVILMIERALQPKDRLLAQLKYSRPIGTNTDSRAFVVQYKRSAEEAERRRRQAQREERERVEHQRLIRQKKHEGLLSRAPSRNIASAFPHQPNQPHTAHGTRLPIPNQIH